MDDADVTVSLARIETKLDRFMDDMKDHEKRLRGLEKWQAQAIGVVAIVSAAITFGLQALLGWFKGGAR